MFLTKLSLPRRTFLRGVGATIALPFLDAMVPAFTATVKAAIATLIDTAPQNIGPAHDHVGRLPV